MVFLEVILIVPVHKLNSEKYMSLHKLTLKLIYNIIHKKILMLSTLIHNERETSVIST